jgi:hypothetical protein
VLDDPAVAVDPEDVDDLVAPLSEHRIGATDDAVGDDEVALGEHPPDVDVEVGELGGEVVDEGDERLEPVGGQRVVLDVLVAAVELDRQLRVVIVERGLVVADDVALVALQLRLAARAVCRLAFAVES